MFALGILGPHELGHWCATRHHRLAVSPPLFIPGPTFAGTFGAFMRLRQGTTHAARRGSTSPPPGRSPASPRCSPMLWTGVALPTPAALDTAPDTTRASGHPALLQAAVAIIHGPVGDGYALALHPLATTAWIGMLLTALNLFPAGQLGGGPSPTPCCPDPARAPPD